MVYMETILFSDKLTLDRHAMKDRSTSHLRIYVGGLPEKANVDDLYEHFVQFGQINGIIVNRNFGFVQFETEAQAQDAIAKADGSVFQGKSLSVRTAQTNTDKRYILFYLWKSLNVFFFTFPLIDVVYANTLITTRYGYKQLRTVVA